MLEDFICSGTEAQQIGAEVRGCWSRPPAGCLKVNTDVAFLESTRTGSTGAVLRDDRGGVLAAATHAYSNVANVLMAEAMAVRDGVLLAIEQGEMRVILETDNATLVTLLHSDDGIRSTIAGVWHEIRELSLSFSSFVCVHVNRESNEAAHLCVRMASVSRPVLSWVGAPPNWLRDAANRDCNEVM